MATTYRDAGVDIEAGDALVERIKPLAQRTFRPGVLSGVGGFGGLFELPAGYRQPVLVSGTDGVGTKLDVAHRAGRHATVGVDLVAMSVNDILTSGAEPLFFLDYLATGKLDVDQARDVIHGVALGCAEAGCALLGGETAEMPGFYPGGQYDLAGFAVGVVEKSEIITGKDIVPGDVVLGIASSGLHSNGYSLARRVLLEDGGLSLEDCPPGLSAPLGDVLLEPTRIYVKDVRALQQAGVRLKGLAHITGGGIPGNLPRCLPEGTRAVVRTSSWERPAIFGLIAQRGQVAEEECYRTFNMGVGFTLVIGAAEAPKALEVLSARGTLAFALGRIEAHTGEPEAVLVP
ncbi:MAG TPA: phosphoribosylformylglycinamidine cyclo-ligase [Myxococcaceae bacterium]|nr:phosphoribosylformylglycinamidine cyclo-ligase [Myxococcaceae bacterium]